MNSAAINRQFLMGAVTKACPTICGSIHQAVPHAEVVQIGDLTEIFARELSQVTNVDTSLGMNALRSNTDNVGVWLNNFCNYVLPLLMQRYKPAIGV